MPPLVWCVSGCLRVFLGFSRYRVLVPRPNKLVLEDAVIMVYYHDINWQDWANEWCVAAPGWHKVKESVWDQKMCRKYVHMTHIAKLWDREIAETSCRRGEGKKELCKSRHFVIRYEEAFIASKKPDSKPLLMNYQLMAMVWAEIVLQKTIDWTTMPARSGAFVDRTNHVIFASWQGNSDCMGDWSNRREGSLPPEALLSDAEDLGSDDFVPSSDDDNQNVQAPVTFGPTNTMDQERADREFQQQMEEAMRRSLTESSPPFTFGPSYGHQYGSGGTRYDSGSAYYGMNPHGASGSGTSSRGNRDYGGSTRGGSSSYVGDGSGGSYSLNPPPTRHMEDYPRHGGTYYGQSSGGGFGGYEGGHGGGSYGHYRGTHYSPPSARGYEGYQGGDEGGSYGHHGGSHYTQSNHEGYEENRGLCGGRFIWTLWRRWIVS